MSRDKNDCIMTPVFDGTRYQHHVCSECRGEIKLTQSCYGGVSFYELEGYQCAKIKFCPQCGSEVIRFSDKPIYETPLDLSPLDVFSKLRREYEHKAVWLYYCYISESHRKQLDALMACVNSKDLSECDKENLRLAKKGKYTFIKITPLKLRKLREQFGGETE